MFIYYMSVALIILILTIYFEVYNVYLFTQESTVVFCLLYSQNYRKENY